MTIPCDEKFHAAYFCQPVERAVYTPIPAHRWKVKCNDDWLLLRNTEKCLVVFDSGDRAISNYDSQRVCSLHNASLFTVNLYDRFKVTDKDRLLKKHILLAMRHLSLTFISTPHVSIKKTLSI